MNKERLTFKALTGDYLMAANPDCPTCGKANASGILHRCEKPAPSDEEIIEAMDTAIFEVSSVHETVPGIAKAIFAAIRAYEKATRAESQRKA